MISAIQECDRDRVVEIWSDSFGDSSAYIKDFLDRRIAETFVYRVNGVAVGIVTLFEIYATIKGTTFKGGYVYALAVDENYRGKGIAKSLLQYIDELLVKRDCVFSFVVPEPYALLENYYKANGYTEEVPIFVERIAATTSEFTRISNADINEYYDFRKKCDNTIVHSEGFFKYVVDDLKQNGAKVYKVEHEGIRGFCICYDREDYVIIKEAVPFDDVNSIAQAVMRETGKQSAVCISHKGKKRQEYALIKKYKDCFKSKLYANLLLDSFEMSL